MLLPVIGDMAVLSALSKADEPADKTPVVLLDFDTITDKIATPIIAVKITITPLTSWFIFLCPML